MNAIHWREWHNNRGRSTRETEREMERETERETERERRERRWMEKE